MVRGRVLRRKEDHPVRPFLLTRTLFGRGLEWARVWGGRGAIVRGVRGAGGDPFSIFCSLFLGCCGIKWNYTPGGEKRSQLCLVCMDRKRCLYYPNVLGSVGLDWVLWKRKMEKHGGLNGYRWLELAG